MSGDLKLLWETVRWLKMRQIVARLKKLILPARAIRTPIATTRRSLDGEWKTSVSRNCSMFGPTRFQFLNRREDIRDKVDWDRPSLPRLWRYNLHYFDDLNAIASVDRVPWHRALINKWVQQNPFHQGTAWEAYPISLRSVNWIKWSLAGNCMDDSWLHSLALQLQWLYKNIEWHILGNHLFANAKALVFGGLYFTGNDANRWLAKGIQILERELPEQILRDGGQFERSPMYHCMAMEDILDLINAAGTWPDLLPELLVKDLRENAVRMLEWMAQMCHPDQRIALFNDSAFGIAPEPKDLISYASRLGISFVKPVSRVRHLKDSGYVCAENDVAFLIADVGEIGPDYLPGHAHADTLSFELSLFGKRLIVDTGCSVYEDSAARWRQRGTAAHNTVVVDGENSSEVWSSFRVARRARPSNVEAIETDGIAYISGSHNGYMRLPGKVTHHRKWKLLAHELIIVDRLDGDFDSGVANLIFHPEVGVQLSGDMVEFCVGAHWAALQVDAGRLQQHEATWHPEFGVSIPTAKISISMQTKELTTVVRW